MLYAVVTETVITSKPLPKDAAEKHREKMLKKINDPSTLSKVRSAVKRIVPKSVQGVNIEQIVEERRKEVNGSSEIVPYDDDERFIVVTRSRLVSKGRYDAKEANHLRGMLVRTYSKIPRRDTMITVDIVAEADLLTV